MSGLQLAICDRALAPGGGAPEWVHLLLAGHIASRDGRQFELPDPGAVILDFQSRGVDLPIDYEHQNDKKAARPNGPVPAAGWIKELLVEDSGIWGRVEWAATARDMIGKREYRYLSPSILFNPKTRQVLRLKGAGLVHSPALYLTALAEEGADSVQPEQSRQSTPASPEVMQKPALSLGLPPDSDAATILGSVLPSAATAREAPDPSRFVPIDAVRDLLSDRNARSATMRESEAKARVELAMNAGHITPAMRGWATALCQQDPESFETFIAKSPAPYAHLTRELVPGRPPGSSPQNQAQASDGEAAICEQLGLKPGSFTRWIPGR